MPQKPISISLRILFIACVWYTVAITNVYQAYVIGLLVNLGFEKCLETLNYLIQSGLEYGYTSDSDVLQPSNPLYKIITRNRRIFESIYKCYNTNTFNNTACYRT